VKNRESQEISLDEMREAINRSGYLIEQRTKTVLEKQAYYVETNRSYPDLETGKSREFDIFGTKLIRAFRGEPGALASIVICECVNNSQPAVFIGSDPPFTLMFHEQVKTSGIPVVVWDHGGYLSLVDFFRFETLFHQCKSPLAKQYCSFSRNKDGGWLAKHPDEQHESFAGLVAAVDSAICEHYENLEPPRPGETVAVNLQIYYPLLVLGGDLYTARQTRHGLNLRPTNHVQYLRQFWSGGHPKACQIDVIQESYLRAYLKLVDTEIQKLRRRLARRREVLTVSMDRLVAEYRGNSAKRVSWREILQGGGPQERPHS